MIEYNQRNKVPPERCFILRGEWYDDLMVFSRRSPSSSASRPAGGSDGEYDSAFADEALSYIDGLYGTALRLTRRPQDAEDLVQDTYLKAFRASKQFERGTNLKAWLYTILHNTFRNMIRHDGRNPVDVNSETVEQAVDASGDEHTPETLLTRATLDGDLQAALDALPDAFRQAVWLRDVEEFSYARDRRYRRRADRDGDVADFPGPAAVARRLDPAAERDRSEGWLVDDMSHG